MDNKENITNNENVEEKEVNNSPIIINNHHHKLLDLNDNFKNKYKETYLKNTLIITSDICDFGKSEKIKKGYKKIKKCIFIFSRRNIN